MLGCARLGALLSEMTAGDAPSGRAHESMALSDIMAGDSADESALDAALGGRRRGGSEA